MCVNDNDKLNISKITTKLLEINHMNKFTKNSKEKEDSFKGELHSSFFSTLIYCQFSVLINAKLRNPFSGKPRAFDCRLCPGVGNLNLAWLVWGI